MSLLPPEASESRGSGQSLPPPEASESRGSGQSLPPGPTAPALMQTLEYARDPLRTLSRWTARHGDTFTARFVGLGRFVVTSSPARIRDIFSADPDALAAGVQNTGLRPLVGPRSLLTLEGAEHQRHRRLMLPMMHGELARRWSADIAETTRRSVARWPVDQDFLLAPRAHELVLEVMVRTLFGFTGEREVATWTARFQRLLDRFSSRFIPAVGILAFLGVDLLGAAPFLPLARAKQELDAALADEMARRRARQAPSSDVFSLLLAARDETGRALEDGEVRDELYSLLVAGHETVGGSLAWLVERLLAHPEVHATLRAELAQGGDGYLDAVVRETLRLRPVLGLIARRTRRLFQLGPYAVPAGTWLAPSIFLAHRRADVYPDPEAFRPERFLGRKFSPWEWLPFGGGSRRCIGMAFSLVSLQVMLATLLRERRLVGDSKPAAIVHRGIALVPAGGVPLRCPKIA
jgi:cytochrome P450